MGRQRRHYRTSPRSLLDLQVAVLGADRQPVLATITDLSGGGMNVSVPLGFGNCWKIGAAVRVRLESRYLALPLEANTLLVRSELTEKEQLLGLRFADWLGLASVLPAELARLFNLRGDARFEFHPGRPVPVTVRGLEVSFEVQGTLRDISPGGLSFHANPIADCALSMTDRVLLKFTLPGAPRAFSFIGRIRHRELTGESIRYGTFFEGNASSGNDQAQALADFIAQRSDAAISETLIR
jgi:hypothetical protein